MLLRGSLRHSLQGLGRHLHHGLFNFQVHPLLLFFPKMIVQVVVAKDYTTTFDEKKTGSDEATPKMQLSQENNNCFYGVVVLLSEERTGWA
jgi:hypothetical protein